MIILTLHSDALGDDEGATGRSTSFVVADEDSESHTVTRTMPPGHPPAHAHN